MTLDAMAAAVDWLDAYQQEDLESILDMYAADAEIECGCGGMKIIRGRVALRAYWEQRLREYPASDMDDLQPAHNGASITYVSRNYRIRTMFEFNFEGKITYLRCGPSH